ncbi:MAG: radical SAM protein [Deltaproteobacteria bacterium]|nr:radical SAM protein [Deltaproteobacteria bacterium]
MRINKSDRAASGFRRRLGFHLHRGKGHLLRYAWNRVRWHYYPRFRMAGGFPDHVDVELSSICNMRCPMCYTLTGEFKERVPGMTMDFDLFCKIVDDLSAHRVFSIRLSWRGEPTLNPRFVDCVRYARGKGIKEIASLTNALQLTPEMFEALVDHQMDWLTISFDGVGEAYEKIRRPAKYEDMVEKIRVFAEIKKRKRSVKPAVRIQGVWPAIAHNPEEFFAVFEPIADEVSVNTLLDYLHKDREIEYVENFVCPVPFQRLVIGSDGRAFMCINDEYGRQPIGDARTQSIGQIWNGEPMRYVRRIHAERKGRLVFESCNACYQPRKTTTAVYRIGDRVICLDELVSRPQVVGQ